MTESRLSNLLPYHVEFINRFLDSDAPPFWHLIAPPGSGKTRMASALIGQMFSSHDAQRVLVLVPAMLSSQYAYMLRDELQSVSVIQVDREFFRELQISAEHSTNPWPSPIVIVVSLDLAKRPDIAQSLITAKWDLVLVDQSHSLAGQRAALLDKMLGANAVGRLLLLGVTDEVALKVPISGLVTWDWYQQVGVLSSAALPSAITLRVIEYERSPSEVNFLGQLNNFVMQLSKGAAKSLQASLLLRAASSSLYAAEQILNRLRNRVVHGISLSAVDADESDEASFVDADQLDEFSDDEPEPKIKTVESAADLMMIVNILNALDEVTDDSKFRALTRLLKEAMGKEMTWVGVFVAYPATASYLKASLEGILKEKVYGLTGNMSYEERSATLHQLRQQGGVLVCSVQLLEGISLDLDAGVIYDLPQKPLATCALLTRFRRPAGKTLTAVYLLRDKSGAIPGEEQLFRLLGSGSENQQADIHGQRQQHSGA